MNKKTNCRGCKRQLTPDNFLVTINGNVGQYCHSCLDKKIKQDKLKKGISSQISTELFLNRIKTTWLKECVKLTSTGLVILHPYTTKIDKSKNILIDIEDAQRVLETAWTTRKIGNKEYVYRVHNRIWNENNVALHRFIMQDEIIKAEKLTGDKWVCVDHINGNPLDNRRCNLRVCTIKENIRNSSTYDSRKSTSKYKGVYNASSCKKYSVSIGCNNISRIAWASKIENEKVAALVYDKLAREFFGEYAWTNEENFKEDFTPEKTKALKAKADLVKITYHQE